jgi:hypothetical protein
LENYELNIEASPIRRNNWFPKGHRPFNKGIPQKEWMDGRKIKKVKKYLEIGRKQGNHNLAGSNKIPIVGIKDGKLIAFNSANDAGRILKGKGIKVNARNINTICHQKERIFKSGKYYYKYIRKNAGGYRWFFADEVEKYKDLLF